MANGSGRPQMTDADDSDPDADAEEKRFEGTFCDASAA